MLKVGDKVKVIDTYDFESLKGKEGVIVVINSNIGVAFEGLENGWLHNLEDFLDGDYGRWFTQYQLIKIEDFHICGLVCKCNPKKAVLL